MDSVTAVWILALRVEACAGRKARRVHQRQQAQIDLASQRLGKRAHELDHAPGPGRLFAVKSAGDQQPRSARADPAHAQQRQRLAEYWTQFLQLPATALRALGEL